MNFPLMGRIGIQAIALVIVQVILILLIRENRSAALAGALVPFWIVGLGCSWAGARASRGRDVLSWLGLAYHYGFLVWLHFLFRGLDFD